MSRQLMTTSSGARIGRGVAALIVLCGLLLGMPAALLAAGGDPIPAHLTSLTRVAHDLTSTDTSGHLFLGVALFVAWAGWAAFTLSVLLELVGRLRNRPAMRIPGLALPRRAAAGLFTAIAIMLGSGGMAASAFAATPTATPAPVVVVIGDPVMLDTAAPATAGTLVYHVQFGDNLGSIAQRFLGHFDLYPRLVAANAALITHGPDHIVPGWTIHLPSDARDRGSRAHASGTLSSTLTESATTGTPVTPINFGTGVDTITGLASSASAHAGAATNGPLVTFGPVTHLTGTGAASDDGASPALVAAAVALTTGVLGAHLLVWQRRRRSTTAADESGHPEPANAIELNRLDLALRDLASLLGERDQTDLPDIMGSWIADGAVHLMLTQPCQAPPQPWVAHGRMWTLPAHVPTHSYFVGTTAPLPALVTVGGGTDRTVLLDLERLGVVTIGGDHNGAHDLLRHVGAELSHGIWSEGVTVGIAGFNEADTRRLTELGQGRVHASVSVAEALDTAGRWINEAHERLAGLGVASVLSGRVSATPAEAWRLSPYALLIAGPDADDIERLERVDAYLAGRGRGQLAIAATQRAGTRWGAGAHNNNMGRWPLMVDADRTVTMDFLDTKIPAVTITDSELASLADASIRPSAPVPPVDVPIGRHRMHRKQTIS
jgi:hypothetical protein